MAEKKLERIAIYSRKSRFTGKGESIENQIEMCRQYIKLQYGEKCAENAVVFEDEGFSGGNLERPQFKKMMTEARRNKFSVIVVYRLDRISRNIGDFAKLIEELADLSVSFVSIKEQFDTSSPMGRAMMYIASVFSQLERETIAERIRDNMHELAKTGRWLGGITPTGYESEAVEKVTVEGKVKKACKLKIIPDEAQLIKLIFDKFLETNSLTKTDTFLLQNGYKSKNGIRFSRFSIRGILTNPTYMIADNDTYHYLTENDADLFSEESLFDGEHGIMAYNRTLQKASKTNVIRPINEWIVSVGAHEGLIPGKQWVKAQKLLDQNAAKGYRKPKSNVALLSGMLFCGNCGDYMRPKLTKAINKDGEQVYKYLCQTKERGHLQCCDSKNLDGNQLDKAVVEEIKKLAEDKSEFMRQLEESKRLILGNKAEYDAEIVRLKLSFEENEKEIGGLVSSLGKASGTSAAEYIVRIIDELHEKNENLKNRIEEIEHLTENKKLSDIEFDLLSRMLASFKNSFDTMSVEQKRAALRAFVKKIIWDGKNVHLYLFGSDIEEIDFPELLPINGNENSSLTEEGGVSGRLGFQTPPFCEDSK